MTTLRDLFTACAPESLERSPHLPTAHRQVISAIPHCRSGHDGQRLSQCHSGGGHHRVQHACGNRHGPQCQQHTTPQWFPHHLDTPLPGPHFLLTGTVPAPLRPLSRSPHRLASPAMGTASAHALKRRAHEERCIGTSLPGFPGIRPPWGRPLQDHPPIHAMVPGGGLAEDRTTWRPSSAHCSVPVKALAPIDCALVKEDMGHAGLLAQIDPLVWHTHWNVHRQAHPNGHTSCQDLAPSVVPVAISTSRIGALTDRTVTCTSRHVGRARPRTAPLDVMALLRRCLPHVFPDGFRNGRPCGVLQASCALPPAPIRLLIVQAHPSHAQPPPPRPPPTARGPLADLGRTEARCHAPVDRTPRLGRYRLSGRTVSCRSWCDTGCTTHGTRAPTSRHQAAHDG